ncbi:MAG: glycoside hydrolase domain-containing protein [Candidatus Scatosoma sp.]
MDAERNVRLELYSSLEKILVQHGVAFPVGGEDGQAKTINKAVVLKNETFCFQADVFLEETQRLFNTFRFEVQGPLKKYVSIYEVEHVPVIRGAYPDADGYLIGTDAGIYPDALMPYVANSAFVMHADRHKTFWLKTASELPSGEHVLTVVLSDYEHREIARRELTLTVKNERLPQSGLIVTTWLHCDCICEQYRVKPFSNRFYKIFREYVKSMVGHGNNTLYTPLFTPALDTEVGSERMTVQLVGVSVNDGKYSFDFSELEKFIDIATSEGIRRFEYCHLFTQWGAEHTPKIVAEVNGRKKRIFGWETDSLCEEYAAFLRAFLPELVKVAEKKKIDAVFHISDEPGETNERYAKAQALVKPYIKNFKIADACGYAFQERGLTDISFVGISEETQADGQEEKSEKKPCGAYYCCGQNKNYVPNRFITMPSLRNRILGLQLYAAHSAGFLQWGYNYYLSVSSRGPVNPYLTTDGKGAYPAGDCFIVYPDVRNGKVIESIRNEVFAEAMQDYRLMLLIEEKFGRNFAEEQIGRFGVNGFTVYPKSETKYIDFINKMKSML